MTLRKKYLTATAVVIILSAFSLTCGESPTDADRPTTVQMEFDATAEQSLPSPLAMELKRIVSKFFPDYGQQISSPGLSKPGAVDEAKLFVLDFTRWETMAEVEAALFTALTALLVDSTSFDEVCIYSGIDTTSSIEPDFWDFITVTFGCYTGDMFIYNGDYDLSVGGNTATGSISVNTGFNFFFGFLRENGVSMFEGELLHNVTAGEQNNLYMPVAVFEYQKRLGNVSISSPFNDDIFDVGESITFSGYALDENGDSLQGGSLVWYSTLDGQIGTGESFSRSDLSAGVTDIWLTATSPAGYYGTDNVLIDIQTDVPIGGTQQGWNTQTSGTTKSLNSVYFTDAATGWAVGD
ncbi:hypothetical protein E3V33_05440, partial [Candidatus Marinimicrobia bacterium MT.SAG.4]